MICRRAARSSCTISLSHSSVAWWITMNSSSSWLSETGRWQLEQPIEREIAAVGQLTFQIGLDAHLEARSVSSLMSRRLAA